MEIDDFPTGPFHVRDADSHGLTRSRIRHAVAAGLLIRIGSGTYRRTDEPDSIALRVLAVRCSVAADQIVVDRTAAWVHGVDLYPAGGNDVRPPIETCSLRGRRATRRGELDGRERDLRPGDIVELDGLRVTSPLRTSLDLGCHLRRREAFAAMCLLARLHGGQVPRSGVALRAPR
ncbi:type IV toxin-antitoxin system AbiEi family antitoxin domain-containing protein [Nocardioides sp. LHD-245]|uniref:type IV toxin-antitoxin system AbiEi family antitoxin domain-containing protein n=1 Tax=Nocardioides sp. LHD-245 TaxID=3051387 RepID=UPI0027DED0F5|nr:type IV toxin-antitoxin system AbiEi family antitoxin domain-containing protein [Nocardioides sp. LHD-245]